MSRNRNEPVDVEYEIVPSAVAIMATEKASLDVQITTAKAYPRNEVQSLERIKALACQDQETAESMFFTLERKDKKTGEIKQIVGESIRFAEIAAYGWGNVRHGFDVLPPDDTHITAVGYCMDLERNV